MASVAAIQSEGDLEVVLLHEAHSVLAEIIGPDLYTVGGTVPDQSVYFHTHSSFNLFLILVVEFFAEGARSAFINEKYQNWSLLKGLGWLCQQHLEEATASGLEQAVSTLDVWIAKEVALEFWCPAVDATISLPLSNERLINFSANATKHHLFRLTDLLGKLEAICQRVGYSFTPQQYPAVLDSMIEEARNRLQYHSSYLIEMLGRTFFGLNRLILARFEKNPTNRVCEMTIPTGVTSDVFRDLYGAVLAFKRYSDQRILKYTPVTTRYLKMRY